jgi:hypothetical protein
MALGVIGCFNLKLLKEMEMEMGINQCGPSECNQSLPQPTVGDYYNRIIQETKLTLERVTIAKAKAETLGMLNYPVQDLRDILGYVI